MDEFKSKILTLLNKQNVKIPSMGFSDSNYHQNGRSDPHLLSVNSKTAPESDRPADQEILESIEAAYFAQTNFDICRFELQKLPEILHCDKIQDDFKLLKRQHQVVSKKVLQMILEHQNACDDEFKEILALCEQLKTTLDMCQKGRSSLNEAGKQVADTLRVLANYKKRKNALLLLTSLKTIKTLHETDEKVRELLAKEEFAKTVELILECQSTANKHKHFVCVVALSNRLQEMLESSEQQLDRVLAENCYYFDEKRYGQLQAAYKLLGKTQIAMDHLHMHYISAVYNSALNIVHAFAENEERDGNGGGGAKRPYKALCLAVAPENLIACLIDLCKAMFKILLSYRQVAKWHERNHHGNGNDGDGNGERSPSRGDADEHFGRDYVRQKLEQNLAKIWQDVQSKVSALLANGSMANYKFEQFLKVLRVVHRLIQVGEEFCNSHCEDLHESIKKQSLLYFKTYHAQRLDELRIFLENESWTVCPVKNNFNILQLQEFKSMRRILRGQKFLLNQQQQQQQQQIFEGGSSASANSLDGSSVSGGNFFLRFRDHGNPFDMCDEEPSPEEEDILLSAHEEISDQSSEEDRCNSDEESNRKYNDGDEGTDGSRREECDGINAQPLSKHILTNTTLSVLRQMGNYLQMSRLLRPIAFDVIECMNQLFDYYLYTVHRFFTQDLTVSSASLYSASLSSSLKRIRDTLINEETQPEVAQQLPAAVRENKPLVPNAQLSPLVDLGKPETLHGLSERLVAVESVVFLVQQYESLQLYLEFLVEPHDRQTIQQFYAQTIANAKDLRGPVYMCVAAQAFDLRQILGSMNRINWEVKEVMSQHNDYIDLILREVQIFAMRLQRINQTARVDIEAERSLWKNVAHIVTHTLVQGFAEAKKCSPCGRALMRLDWTHFAQTFKAQTKMRKLPHEEYVDNYIKAYYIPDNELDSWIREHTEYSAKHFVGLINCVCPNNKKSKQRLLQVVDELEKRSMLR